VTTILPGPVRQTGFVVRDLDRALSHWVDALGIGPWITLDSVVLDPTEYRGQPVVTPLRMALAQSGDLQIELIQALDDSPSCYREFLDAGHEGLHHLAWWTDDYDGVARAVADAGWGTVQSEDLMGTHFCYLDTPAHPGTIAEVMELTDATRWLATYVREAAETWDGVTDPVRAFG
jgi:catechol 2,3-dioxygenase-like lactoylglutathione lyase family enzyme